MGANASVCFFDAQFQRQVRDADLTLNPFGQQALPYLHGAVLDYGCGLGNLAVAAARKGCSVVALSIARPPSPSSPPTRQSSRSSPWSLANLR